MNKRWPLVLPFGQYPRALLGLCALGICLGRLSAAPTAEARVFPGPPPSVWSAGVGEGFASGAQEAGIAVGAGLGMKVLGSRHTHDWGVASVHYGRMLTPILAPDRWYRGNLELVAELFGARQFRADPGSAGGIAPMLRYDFATGHRWVPFVGVGAGLTWTDIRDGDLSTPFEFNVQGAAGLNIFLRRNVALTVEYRFIHISDAGLGSPNLGLNTSNVLLGMSCFF